MSSRHSNAADTAAGSRMIGLLLVASAAVIWSTGGLIVRSLEATDSWTAIFWRSLFAAAFLACWLVVRHGRRALAVFLDLGPAGLLVATGFALASTCLVVALRLTSVAHVLMIMSTAPLLAAVLARLTIGEPIGLVRGFAILVSIAGIGVMVQESLLEGSILGDLVAFLIACGYALSIVTLRRHREIEMTPATLLATLMAAASVTTLASPLAPPLHDMLLLALFGAGQLGLGLALFAVGAPRIPAAEAALLGTLETILGPVWVWLLLGEAMSLASLTGSGLVVLALAINLVGDFVNSRRPRPRRRVAARHP